MYDSDSYSDWHNSLQTLESAAAASEIACGPLQGEVWRIITAAGYHDDPAAHDVYWSIRQGATTRPFENGSNEPTNYKHQLYDRVKCQAPVLLRYGEAIVFGSTAPMAAGKKMYANVYAQVLVGVTS